MNRTATLVGMNDSTPNPDGEFSLNNDLMKPNSEYPEPVAPRVIPLQKPDSPQPRSFGSRMGEAAVHAVVAGTLLTGGAEAVNQYGNRVTPAVPVASELAERTRDGQGEWIDTKGYESRIINTTGIECKPVSLLGMDARVECFGNGERVASSNWFLLETERGNSMRASAGFRFQPQTDGSLIIEESGTTVRKYRKDSGRAVEFGNDELRAHSDPRVDKRFLIVPPGSGGAEPILFVPNSVTDLFPDGVAPANASVGRDGIHILQDRGSDVSVLTVRMGQNDSKGFALNETTSVFWDTQLIDTRGILDEALRTKLSGLKGEKPTTAAAIDSWSIETGVVNSVLTGDDGMAFVVASNANFGVLPPATAVNMTDPDSIPVGGGGPLVVGTEPVEARGVVVIPTGGEPRVMSLNGIEGSVNPIKMFGETVALTVFTPGNLTILSINKNGERRQTKIPLPANGHLQDVRVGADGRLHVTGWVPVDDTNGEESVTFDIKSRKPLTISTDGQITGFGTRTTTEITPRSE